MKQTIFFKCTNEECVEFGNEIEVELKDYWNAKFNPCGLCQKIGAVEVKHGDRTFSALEAFNEYLAGLVRESKLLKKLIDRGVANTDETEQYKENTTLLAGATCPCCGQDISSP